ncbi:MAG: TIGR03067 domain-containing protein [Akkermansiaceae bacterium]|nr:TIGR03067 domain-containing protein [Akkermansiaceae bacterium]
MKYIRETTLAGILLIGFAHGEQNKNPLIGEWKLKKLEGVKYDVAAKMKVFWTFDKSEVVVTATDTREEASRMTYVIDTSKTPHWITANVSDSLTGNKKDKRLGIFRFVGDELHIKWEIKDGGARPTKFTEGRVAKFTRTPKK